MNKIKALVLGLSCVANVQAGTMGAVNANLPGSVFVGVEGGWTWNELENGTLTVAGVGSFTTVDDNDGGTARVSLGMMKSINDVMAVSAEFGYGYYGKTDFSVVQVSGAPVAGLFNTAALGERDIIDGFDVLGGLNYRLSMVDLFFKAGAMVQNVRSKSNLDFISLGTPGAFLVNINSNNTEVLPEVKVGLAYNVMDRLALTAAYTHVFGENQGANFNAVFNPTTGAVTSLSGSINLQNPSLDVATLGLTYSMPI